MIHIDSENNIQLTRGDTGVFTVALKDKDGAEYTPSAGSTMRFAVAKKYGASEGDLLIEKNIPVSTMTLEIAPEDTKDLPFKKFLYDIELTTESGKVATVVMAEFEVTKEVY